MNKMIALCLGGVMVAGTVAGCTQSYAYHDRVTDKSEVGKYTMPDERSKHEGTWLIWPHHYTFGAGHKEKLEEIWIDMTAHLSEGEQVHIIAYNKQERDYIYDLLYDEDIDMDAIDFYMIPTDDVWARDTAPLFVYDEDNNLKLMDWGFNGWGEKTPYAKDALIASRLSEQLGMERIDLTEVILEGGAFELDGNGTFLSTRSAVTNENRNAHLSETEIEQYVEENLGATNFIWLDGVRDMDITDFHIDGIVKFYDQSTMITMNEEDLRESGATNKDIQTLMSAKDAFNNSYKYEYLPISKYNVVLEDGENLGYKGFYINYYIGNTVVLVPNYNDPHDKVANDRIQALYPDRKVVGIDVRELYKDGGMIHCITQQQPIGLK